MQGHLETKEGQQEICRGTCKDSRRPAERDMQGHLETKEGEQEIFRGTCKDSWRHAEKHTGTPGDRRGSIGDLPRYMQRQQETS